MANELIIETHGLVKRYGKLVAVNDLSLEDAVQLVAAVFEVNADFFVAQVVPSIQGAAERLAPTLRTLTNAVGSPPGIAPSPA